LGDEGIRKIRQSPNPRIPASFIRGGVPHS
jgi:hypothetical protein